MVYVNERWLFQQWKAPFQVSVIVLSKQGMLGLAIGTVRMSCSINSRSLNVLGVRTPEGFGIHWEKRINDRNGQIKAYPNGLARISNCEILRSTHPIHGHGFVKFSVISQMTL
jgi:hypothetical protein